MKMRAGKETWKKHKRGRLDDVPEQENSERSWKNSFDPSMKVHCADVDVSSTSPSPFCRNTRPLNDKNTFKSVVRMRQNLTSWRAKKTKSQRTKIPLNNCTAIAQWNRLRLPSCRPRFESQAHHLRFYHLQYLWK